NKVSPSERSERQDLEKMEKVREKIILMMLNIITSELHRYIINDNIDFDVEEYVQNHLSDLIAIEIISETLSPDGYSPINILLWARWVSSFVDAVDIDTYVSMTVRIIKSYKNLGIKCKRS